MKGIHCCPFYNHLLRERSKLAYLSWVKRWLSDHVFSRWFTLTSPKITPCRMIQLGIWTTQTKCTPRWWRTSWHADLKRRPVFAPFQLKTLYKNTKAITTCRLRGRKAKQQWRGCFARKNPEKKQPVRCRGNKFGFEKINGVLVREIWEYYQPENVNGRNIYWKFSERQIERIYWDMKNVA